MRHVVKVLGVLGLALLLPACGKKKQSQYTIEGLPFPTYNSDTIDVDAQNNDAADYNLSLREFTNGTLTAQANVVWPVPAAAGGSPGNGQGHWNFHEDSAVYTHTVVIFDQVGLAVDQKPFVKGNVPLLLMATITSATMTVQTSP